MELTFWAIKNLGTKGVPGSLNPCCFGTYFLRLYKYSQSISKMGVLILVVLELTFWASKWAFSSKSVSRLNPCCFGTYFLSKEDSTRRWCLWCLNPCCFGTYFLSWVLCFIQGSGLEGLNPCCFGTYFLSFIVLLYSINIMDKVLILVVLELTFWVAIELALWS